jgi:hypothetical protein
MSQEEKRAAFAAVLEHALNYCLRKADGRAYLRDNLSESQRQLFDAALRGAIPSGGVSC